MKKYRGLIIILLVIVIISVFLIYKTLNNRGSPKEEIAQKEENDYRTNFALMIEQEDGTYKESNNNKWPDDYKLNIEKSKCIDKDGNEIKDILSNNSGTVQVRTTTTSYCYLYFDIPTYTAETLPNIASDIWESTLEGDGYRYVGTNPNNYICFGTTDKNTCTADTDKYMYRIIGIFEGTDGEQHLKLIKKEALNTSYVWSNRVMGTDWDETDLYLGLNRGYFLTNSTYSYMQDSNWLNKIAVWNYTTLDSKEYTPYGINYRDTLIEQIYMYELNRSNKITTTDEWKLFNGKISLMYVSDYLLSLGSNALEYTSYTDRTTLKTGWMHISNNDSDVNSSEWTMTSTGSGYIEVICVNTLGSISNLDSTKKYSSRPVFYLTSDIEITGEGTIDNPYIITN